MLTVRRKRILEKHVWILSNEISKGGESSNDIEKVTRVLTQTDCQDDEG